MTVAAQGVDAALLSPANFRRLCALIKTNSGIKIPPSKQTMLGGRLTRRVRALGFADVDRYCDYLFSAEGLEAELVHAIDAVTTNKTDFFREPKHFEHLSDQFFPEFLKTGRREIKVWSAACSTGAEPYTLAMVLETFCALHAGLAYSILATDICTEVLAQALAGCFPQSAMAPVPADFRRRYVRRSIDSKRNEVRMAPQLRSRIAFGRLNLMDAAYPVGADMDLIFCRNVLIYFERDVQAQVLRRLCGHLRQGGRLVLGHAESTNGYELPLVAVAHTVFQKV